jgi:hypothetical protein
MFSRLFPRSFTAVRSSFPCFTFSCAFSPSVRHFSTAAPVKLTTGITGLDVVPNGREVLIGLYRETLRLLSTYECNAMNDNLKQWTQYRLKIVESQPDIPSVEAAFDDGQQIEELIDTAENELDLLVVFNEEVKPWNFQDDGDLEENNGGLTLEEGDKEQEHWWQPEDPELWKEIDQELGLEGVKVKDPLEGFTGKTVHEAIVWARKNFRTKTN